MEKTIKLNNFILEFDSDLAKEFYSQTFFLKGDKNSQITKIEILHNNNPYDLCYVYIGTKAPNSGARAYLNFNATTQISTELNGQMAYGFFTVYFDKIQTTQIKPIIDLKFSFESKLKTIKILRWFPWTKWFI